MQKKKNIALLVSFVVMLVITVILVLRPGQHGSSRIDKDLFRVADLKSINKVTLQQGARTTTLSFNGARWEVNGKIADRNLIDVLFATIDQAVPKRSIGSSQGDSISRSLEREGVKVTLSSEAETKTFYAGGNEQKTLAYFRLPDQDPCVVVIPGYRVYTSGIFELNEVGWMDKFVFGFNWRNFRSLKASFPARPEEDFTIVMNDGRVVMEEVAKVDTANLNTFLDQVSLLTVDQYVDDGQLTDSLSRQNPLMVIQVNDIARREYSLAIFQPLDRGKRPVGLLSKSQPAFFDPERLNQIVKPRSFFRGK